MAAEKKKELELPKALLDAISVAFEAKQMLSECSTLEELIPTLEPSLRVAVTTYCQRLPLLQDVVHKTLADVQVQVNLFCGARPDVTFLMLENELRRIKSPLYVFAAGSNIKAPLRATPVPDTPKFAEKASEFHYASVICANEKDYEMAVVWVCQTWNKYPAGFKNLDSFKHYNLSKLELIH